MDDYHGFTDSNSNGSFTAQIKIRKTFTIYPKHDYETGQWVCGECYKDDWNNVYRKETAVAGLLKGTLTLDD